MEIASLEITNNGGVQHVNCDWCMHKLFFGKVMVMILTGTIVVDYGKDLYVASFICCNIMYIIFIIEINVIFTCYHFGNH